MQNFAARLFLLTILALLLSSIVFAPASSASVSTIPGGGTVTFFVCASGYACSTSPCTVDSTCNPVCGDNIKVTEEACDIVSGVSSGCGSEQVCKSSDCTCMVVDPCAAGSCYASCPAAAPLTVTGDTCNTNFVAGQVCCVARDPCGTGTCVASGTACPAANPTSTSTVCNVASSTGTAFISGGRCCNPSPASVCGNNVIETGEVCDGTAHGVCAWYGSCSNAVAGGNCTSCINQPPVAGVSPADGSSFVAGTAITVTASGSDPEGFVTEVDVFAAGATLKQCPVSPAASTGSCSGTWTPTVTGDYIVQSNVYDPALLVYVQHTIHITAPAFTCTDTAGQTCNLTTSCSIVSKIDGAGTCASGYVCCGAAQLTCSPGTCDTSCVAPRPVATTATCNVGGSVCCLAAVTCAAGTCSGSAVAGSQSNGVACNTNNGTSYISGGTCYVPNVNCSPGTCYASCSGLVATSATCNWNGTSAVSSGVCCMTSDPCTSGTCSTGTTCGAGTTPISDTCNLNGAPGEACCVPSDVCLGPGASCAATSCSAGTTQDPFDMTCNTVNGGANVCCKATPTCAVTSPAANPVSLAYGASQTFTVSYTNMDRGIDITSGNPACGGGGSNTPGWSGNSGTASGDVTVTCSGYAAGTSNFSYTCRNGTTGTENYAAARSVVVAQPPPSCSLASGAISVAPNGTASTTLNYSNFNADISSISVACSGGGTGSVSGCSANSTTGTCAASCPNYTATGTMSVSAKNGAGGSLYSCGSAAVTVGAWCSLSPATSAVEASTNSVPFTVTYKNFAGGAYPNTISCGDGAGVGTPPSPACSGVNGGADGSCKIQCDNYNTTTGSPFAVGYTMLNGSATVTCSGASVTVTNPPACALSPATTSLVAGNSASFTVTPSSFVNTISVASADVTCSGAASKSVSCSGGTCTVTCTNYTTVGGNTVSVTAKDGTRSVACTGATTTVIAQDLCAAIGTITPTCQASCRTLDQHQVIGDSCNVGGVVCCIPNAAPNVSITSPAANTVYTLPVSNIGITATATDDSAVSNVGFYYQPPSGGDNFISSANSSPYAASWSPGPNPLPGTYTVKATATDDQGFWATATRPVIINKPPAISFTAPSAGSSYVHPASIGLGATASDPDGTISTVGFSWSNNTNCIANPGGCGWNFINNGTKSGSTYSQTWDASSQGPGTYYFLALATDNLGGQALAVMGTVTILAQDSCGSGTCRSGSCTLSNEIAASSGPDASCNWDGTAAVSSGVCCRAMSCQISTSSTLIVDGAINYPVAPTNFSMGSAADITAKDCDTGSTDGGLGIVSSCSGGSCTVQCAYTSGGNKTVLVTARDSVSTTKSASCALTSNINAPPTVSINPPANGASFTPGSNITIAAAASDPDGTINSVQFLSGSTPLGTDTASPYSYIWNNVGAGTYTLTATATDNRSAATTSAAVTIYVYPSLSASAAGPYTGSINAAVSLTGGASGGSGGYSYSWSTASAGCGFSSSTAQSPTVSCNSGGAKSITLTVTDSVGHTDTKTSGLAINAPPTVSITAPANNSSYNQPATVSLTASASDSDGTITGVEYLNGAASLGSSTTAAGGYPVTPVPFSAGTYTITARATDNSGDKTTSAGVTITVQNACAAGATCLSSCGAQVSDGRDSTCNIGGGTVCCVPAVTVSTGGPYTGTTNVPVATSSVVGGGITPYAYSWSFVAPNTGTCTFPGGTATSTAQNPAITCTSAGSAGLRLTAVDASGQIVTSANSSVTVYNVLAANAGADATTAVGASNITIGASPAASGGLAPYTYSWTVFSGSSCTMVNPTNASTQGVSCSNTGAATFRLTVTDARTVTAADDVIVTANSALNANAGADKSVIVNPSTGIGTGGLVVTLGGSAGGGVSPYSYSWSGPGECTISNTSIASPNISCTSTSQKTIALSVTDGRSTISTDTMTLTVNPALAASAGTNKTAVQSVGMQLTGTTSGGNGGNTYLWTITSGSSCTISNPTTLTPTFNCSSTGLRGVRLTVNDSTSNTASDTMFLNVVPALTITTTGPYAGTTIAPIAISQTTSGGTAPYSSLWTIAPAGCTIAAPSSASTTVTCSRGTYTLTSSVSDSSNPFLSTTTNTSLTVNEPPTVSITSPASGSNFLTGANITVAASAGDADGTITKVEFYAGTTLLASDTSSPYSYTQANTPRGNYTVTAVATDNRGASTTSAPVTVNVYDPIVSAPGGPYIGEIGAAVPVTGSASAGSGGYAYLWTTSSSGCSIASATSAGTTITCNSAGAKTVSLRATDSAGNSDTKSPSFSINFPPTISIASPATGSLFTALASISLTANASDSDGTVSRVDYFSGTTNIGFSTNAGSNFPITWSGVGSGAYTLSAKAMDNRGIVTTSPAITVSVNSPPVVSLTAPANGASYVAQATIPMSATASDPDGSISKVDFYSSSSPSTPLGTTTTSPFNYTWTNVGAASYTLTAKATDNQGAAVTSSGIGVTVVPANPCAAGATCLTSCGAQVSDGRDSSCNINGGSVCCVPALTVSAGGPYSGTKNIATPALSPTVLEGILPYNYSWDFVAPNTGTCTYNPGGALSTSSAPTITCTSAGSAGVRLTVIDASNQIVSGTNTVMNSYDALVANAGAGTTTAVGPASVTIGTTPAAAGGLSPYTYAWTVASGTSCARTGATNAATQAIACSQTGSTTFRLTVTDARGTTATDDILVNVNSALTANAGPDRSVIVNPSAGIGTGGTVVVLSGSVGGGVSPYAYSWTSPAGGCTIANGTTASPGVSCNSTGPKTITATITDSAGSPASTDTMVLTVNPPLTANAGAAKTAIVSVAMPITGTTAGGNGGNTYLWAIISGSPCTFTGQTTLTVTANCATTGNRVLRLTATDSTGNSATSTMALGVVTALAITTTGPYNDEILRDINVNATTTGGTPPYIITWSASGGGCTFAQPNSPKTTIRCTAVGTYTLTLTVSDSSNPYISSAGQAQITAIPQNIMPTVSVTAPAAGSVGFAPATVTLSANATDADGTISAVEFYNGPTLLGTDTTSPYSYSWTAIPVGAYSISAKAYDNKNGATVSQPVSLIIVAQDNCSGAASGAQCRLSCLSTEGPDTVDAACNSSSGAYIGSGTCCMASRAVFTASSTNKISDGGAVAFSLAFSYFNGNMRISSVNCGDSGAAAEYSSCTALQNTSNGTCTFTCSNYSNGNHTVAVSLAAGAGGPTIVATSPDASVTVSSASRPTCALTLSPSGQSVGTGGNATFNLNYSGFNRGISIGPSNITCGNGATALAPTCTGTAGDCTITCSNFTSTGTAGVSATARNGTGQPTSCGTVQVQVSGSCSAPNSCVQGTCPGGLAAVPGVCSASGQVCCPVARSCLPGASCQSSCNATTQAVDSTLATCNVNGGTTCCRQVDDLAWIVVTSASGKTKFYRDNASSESIILNITAAKPAGTAANRVDFSLFRKAPGETSPKLMGSPYLNQAFTNNQVTVTFTEPLCSGGTGGANPTSGCATDPNALAQGNYEYSTVLTKIYDSSGTDITSRDALPVNNTSSLVITVSDESTKKVAVPEISPLLLVLIALGVLVLARAGN